MSFKNTNKAASIRMELLHNIASSPDPLHQVDLVYKRPMVYAKMETLIKEMQDEESGVPVRSQKVFLSSIPAAFAGYDIIEWLMERLNIEDSGEAIHLANLLCQHGYFFPVGANNNPNLNFSVKDDSSLYRFQTPYYWPNRTTLCGSTDTSVDYAIYLSKRTLRNKPKHALDDYEVDAYSDLKSRLSHKWDFVSMQADEQLRLMKDRKKYDKLVMDSQERAYWRVVRPPPGSPCCIETPPTFNASRGTTKIVRKTNNLLLEDLRNEVELLRNSCIRTRIKVSTALESLASHCESYHEHDPLLVPRQPSNPWHTEDPTYWVLNADMVDTPTERRAKKWAISPEDLIFDPTGMREFTAYLNKEYCSENIRFWVAVRDMKFGPISLLRAKAQEIYNEFLCPGSQYEINIDMRTMEAVQKELNFLVPSRFTFDPAAEHVYLILLKKDCYPRFIRSEHYKTIVQQSQQLSSKTNSKRLDKFFSFVADRKKKSSGSDEQKIKHSDHSSKEQDLTSMADNIPYRGDLDNNAPHLSGQDSLDDICCPWESASDRTTSTDRTRVNKGPDKGAPLKQKSQEEKSSMRIDLLIKDKIETTLTKRQKSQEDTKPSSTSASSSYSEPPSTSGKLMKQGSLASTSRRSSQQSQSQELHSVATTVNIVAPIVITAPIIPVPVVPEPEVVTTTSTTASTVISASSVSVTVAQPEPQPRAPLEEEEESITSKSEITPPPPPAKLDLDLQPEPVASTSKSALLEMVQSSQPHPQQVIVPTKEEEEEVLMKPSSSSKLIPEPIPSCSQPPPPHDDPPEPSPHPPPAKQPSKEKEEEPEAGPDVKDKDPEEEEDKPKSKKKDSLTKQLSRKKSTTSSSSQEVVCPWDCENGSAPETTTFTKTYSTLGYL